MVRLVHEYELWADISTVDDLGDAPTGRRLIGNVAGGEFAGPRFTGTLEGSAGDWLLVGADGFSRPDVRATLKTHDGALVYMQYLGMLELTPSVIAVIGGGGIETQYGDQYFFTQPRMETSDPRYDWLNRSVFIGQGRMLPSAEALRVEYQVYRVDNG